jgi:hypothetical protein
MDILITSNFSFKIERNGLCERTRYWDHDCQCDGFTASVYCIKLIKLKQLPTMGGKHFPTSCGKNTPAIDSNLSGK